MKTLLRCMLAAALATLASAAPAMANDPPACPSVAPGLLSVAQNGSLPLQGACTDEPADTLTYHANQPQHGTVTPSDGDGRVTYVPDHDYVGPDSFTYYATDQLGASSAVATVNLTVFANHAPTCAPPAYVTPVNTVLVFSGLSCSDPDPGDSVASFGLAQGPGHGRVDAGPPGVAFYTPAQDYQGADHFTFTVTDTHGATSGPIGLDITVGNPAANTKPTCPSTALAVAFEGSLTLTGECSDPENDPLSYFVPAFSAQGGSITPSGPNTAVYHAPAGYSGADSFSYHATDSHGLDSDPATVTLQVAPAGASVANLAPGGTTPTSPEATPGEPVLTALTSPAGGPVIIQSTALAPMSPPPPSGFAFLEQQVTIEARPAPTASQPLELAFTLDRSLFKQADTKDTVVVYRDGDPVHNCVDDPALPCVSRREYVDPSAPDTSDVRLVVLTDHASRWNFGVPAQPGKGCGDQVHAHERQRECKK